MIIPLPSKSPMEKELIRANSQMYAVASKQRQELSLIGYIHEYSVQRDQIFRKPAKYLFSVESLSYYVRVITG